MNAHSVRGGCITQGAWASMNEQVGLGLEYELAKTNIATMGGEGEGLEATTRTVA